MPRFESQQEHVWDIVIIGAGMGGSLAAHALAKAGRDVLLIDYGNEDLTVDADGRPTDEQERRLSENHWPYVSAYKINGIMHRAHLPLGSGVGGSTNLYAAALERFAERDIDAHSDLPHPTGGWAVPYAELLPYYEEAEKLLHVVGTQDPLGAAKGDHIQPPPPLGPCDTHFFEFFEEAGLHPYRLHVGIRYRPGCDECLGRLCFKSCRADARSVLAESFRKPTIMARSEVVELQALPNRITGATVRQEDKVVRVQARVYILAAGAIHSPKLLLRSKSDHWPQGLANHSGLVGRNLMFHAAQTFVLWPKRKLSTTGPRKSLSFRDLYGVDGQRYGCVQSTGFDFGYGGLLMHFYDRFDNSRFKALRIIRPALRIPAAVANNISGPGTVFACIIEDMPYLENRVIVDDREGDGVVIEYTIKRELRDRTSRFRELLEERLAGRKLVFLSNDVELNFGHPCGTCVMNDDPSRGVVDRDCRAHGISNLFIADASFMPSSAAINPSLTVAANALRVAGRINRLLAGDVE